MILSVVSILCLALLHRAEAEGLRGGPWCDCPPWTAVPPKGVEVDITKFIGRWYEMWTTFGVQNTFEKDTTCVTADYYSPFISTTGLSSFKFVNNGNKKFPKGGLVSESDSPSRGTATQACDCVGGKYTLSMDGVDAAGAYIVYKVGPVSDAATGLYDYIVVATPLGTLGWILASNPDAFKRGQESDLLAELKSDGFVTPFNSFSYETYQGSECRYGPLPADQHGIALF